MVFIFVNTIQYLHTLKNNFYHSNKPGPPPFFHWNINHVLGHSLVNSVDKTHVLVVTVELIWLLFLSILSLNFVSALNKFLSFTRFRSSYVTRLAVVLIKVTPYFCLMCDVQSGHMPFFCSCLSQMIVHLRNLFLLNTPVARMLFIARWVSRRKDLK